MAKHQTWHERQAAYVAAVKDLLLKLNSEFASLEVKFVRSMRVEPRLYLSVECASAFQLVISFYFLIICQHNKIL